MASEVTPEMIHEAEAHLPWEVKTQRPRARWEWIANFLNNAIKNPDVPCPCCKVTPAGDVLDYLSDEQVAAMQPKDSSNG